MTTRSRPAALAALVLCLAAPVLVASPAGAKVTGATRGSIEPSASARLPLPATPCAVAREAVAREGALVIATGPHTYDRFVSGQGYCSIGQTTEAAFARAADAPACFVGYLCKGDEGQSDRSRD